MHIYETDKNMNVLYDKLLNDIWLETEIYHPADLPDIDFQEAYRSVKAVAGDKPIANIAVFLYIIWRPIEGRLYTSG